jgi:hypothetical protein
LIRIEKTLARSVACLRVSNTLPSLTTPRSTRTLCDLRLLSSDSDSCYKTPSSPQTIKVSSQLSGIEHWRDVSFLINPYPLFLSPFRGTTSVTVGEILGTGCLDHSHSAQEYRTIVRTSLSEAGPSNQFDTIQPYYSYFTTPRSFPSAILSVQFHWWLASELPNRSFVCPKIRIPRTSNAARGLSTASLPLHLILDLATPKTKHLYFYTTDLPHRLTTYRRVFEPCILNLVRQWPHRRSQRPSCFLMKLNKVYHKMPRLHFNKLTIVSSDIRSLFLFSTLVLDVLLHLSLGCIGYLSLKESANHRE